MRDGYQLMMKWVGNTICATVWMLKKTIIEAQTEAWNNKCKLVNQCICSCRTTEERPIFK